ncbi:MAG: hypothetical protein GWP17_03140 [Aquificales bacterium]|nr:hypothetical protein [Aquificales bacterium]
MADEILGYKLLLSYEVKEESVQEYYRFVMGQYVPALQSMGLQMSEVWQTAYGDAPNRLIGFVCKDQDTMTGVLHSDNWLSLNEQLENFVTDFGYKVVPYRGGFQI